MLLSKFERMTRVLLYFHSIPFHSMILVSRHGGAMPYHLLSRLAIAYLSLLGQGLRHRHLRGTTTRQQARLEHHVAYHLQQQKKVRTHRNTFQRLMLSLSNNAMTSDTSTSDTSERERRKKRKREQHLANGGTQNTHEPLFRRATRREGTRQEDSRVQERAKTNQDHEGWGLYPGGAVDASRGAAKVRFCSRPWVPGKLNITVAP